MQQRKSAPKFWKKLFVSSPRRTHFVAVGATAISTVILLSLLPSDKVEANRQIHSIELPGIAQYTNEIANGHRTDSALSDENKISEITNSAANSGAETAGDQQWQPTTLVKGDNLTSIFRRLGLTDKDVYAVANAKHEASQLRRLKPGETIAVALNNEGSLAEVKYSRSRLEHYMYRRGNNGFNGEKVLYEPETVATFQQGRIQSSLFLDASRAGLSEAKIMEMANIFAWDVDFALDIRNGDQFSVLYEEKYLEGEKIGYGDILAASFTNQGKTYEAVRFKAPDGSVSYYSPDGKPMRKAFLRAPLDFTRISSNFNMRRKHPIHKRIKAHRGVDYAAPRGTPVYAAGNGKVIAAGYSRPNGNYVFIKHGEKFITRYLHLTKRKVRRGQTVKQRQTIGTVGSTGYATGPHLHYEFLVNGVHRNPRTVKLPQATSIAANKKAEFIKQTGPVLARLKQLGSTQLALLSSKP